MQPTLATGSGKGGDFVRSEADRLAEAIGFRPYPGTLNLTGAEVSEYSARTIDEVGDGYCEGVELRPCRVSGVRAAVIRPFVPEYPPEKTEILAPIGLRDLFDLSDGDPVTLHADERGWPPASQHAQRSALDGFAGVVFDLDGTLVDLNVDWAVARAELEERIGGQLDRPIRSYDAPELFEIARERGVYEALVSVLTKHELAGVERATPLSLVEVLPELSIPVGICTANATEVADRVLASCGVRDDVAVIVGRETVAAHKPAPEPLVACLDALDVAPGNAVFIGDLPSDAETAVAAGTSFLSTEQLSAS